MHMHAYTCMHAYACIYMHAYAYACIDMHALSIGALSTCWSVAKCPVVGVSCPGAISSRISI